MPRNSSGVSMDLWPMWAWGRRATFRVTFRNNGAGPVAVSLGAIEVNDALHLQIRPSAPVMLQPGGAGLITLSVRPKERRLIGDPQLHSIRLRGVVSGRPDDPDPALQREAVFTHAPRSVMLPAVVRNWPAWITAPLIVLLAGAGLLAGGGAVVALSRAILPARAHVRAAVVVPTAVPDAQIRQFTIVQGMNGLQQLEWSATGGDTVTLNGKLVTAAGADLLRLTGPATMILSASHARASVAQVLSVAPARANVSEPAGWLRLPVIRLYEAAREPGTGRLALAWRVSGAVSVRLRGVLVAKSGIQDVDLSNLPSSYQLQAANRLGSVTRSLVLPPAPAPRSAKTPLAVPVIEQFALVHGAGKPYALVWRTRNAARVTLNGEPVLASATFMLTPPLQSTRYSLEASSLAGRMVARVNVVVKGD